MPAPRFNELAEAKINQRVLIVYPGKDLSGGVAELYNVAGLQSGNIHYFSLYGPLRNRFSLLDTLFMYARFLSRVYRYDVIHINPSLMKKSFFRDGLLVFISRIFGKKILVYWHGWIDEVEQKIKTRFIYSQVFRVSFKRADASVVLGTVFREKLRALGYQHPIYLETNCADDHYFLEDRPAANGASLHHPVRLLFLSRLEKTKGVYIAMETLRLLNESAPDRYELVIAGDGEEFANVKEYAEINRITAVSLLGRIGGRQKHEVLKNTDILLFPTYYDEGMPIVILESMTYGIPVVTRPVGGIPDVVENKKNGLLSESKDPRIFAELVSSLYNEPETYRYIHNTNTDSARAFSPENFKERMKVIYNSL